MSESLHRIHPDSSPNTVATMPRSRWKSAQLEAGVGYLWFFGAIAAFNPYVAMYYGSKGFSGLEVGVLTAMPAVGLALSGAFWGSVMDALGIHRTVLRVALLLTALFAIAVARVDSFISMLVCVTALSFSLVPLRALLDNYAVAVSERTGSSFGTIRSWGSIGYFVSVLGLGRLMGVEITNLFLYAYAGFLVLTFISTIRLPKLSEKQPSQIISGLKDVASNKPLLLLLLVAFLLMLGYACIYLAFGLHMRSLGGSTDQVGQAFAVGAAAEMPAFIFGGRLIRKFGYRKIILFAIAAYAVRFLLVGTITDPMLLIPVQLLHMVTFALFLVASVPLAHLLAGGKNPATTQALLTTTSFGFGNIVGSVGGGMLMDYVGSGNLFLIASGLMVACLVLFYVGSRALGFDQVIRRAERGARGLSDDDLAAMKEKHASA